MVDPDSGEPHTAHTTNPVPLMITGVGDGAVLKNGKLCDIAPTIIELMKLKKPNEMTGENLLSI